MEGIRAAGEGGRRLRASGDGEPTRVGDRGMVVGKLTSRQEFLGHQMGVPPLNIDNARIPMIDDSVLDPDLFVSSRTRSR